VLPSFTDLSLQILSASNVQRSYEVNAPQTYSRAGQVRFEYVASGTEILFRDHADPAPRSRRVFFFHQPETLQRWLADPITIRGRLQTMPALVTVGLYDCQIEAVTGLEKSLAADEPRALIQAATGAGKTNTDETEELPSGWGWASIDQLTRRLFPCQPCT